ncbi:MAG: hypothetical protein IKS32_10290 [Solobacterium sp.]|nr:hypothetical protein [Solobacterium sp.]
MSENNRNRRPTGRKPTEATGSGKVFKRGEGLNTGKVGNADYEERKAGSGGHASGSGNRGTGGNPLNGIGGLGQGMNSGGYGHTSHSGHSNDPLNQIGGMGGYRPGNPYTGPQRVRRGLFGGGLFRIIIMLILIMFVMNMLGMCGRSDSYYSDPYETFTATYAPSAPASGSQNSSSTGGTWKPPVPAYTDTNQESVSTNVASGARDKFTKILGGGQDQVTVLIYMCGTDLESQYGMATSDLNEMLYASHSDKVNILVETGGTKRWKNSVVSSSTNQRWKVSDRSIIALDKKVGKKAMSDPETLADFIRWGASEYPANRYFLILWDHGGGSLSGYARDELYPNGTMTVDEIASALKNGGVKFDAVGFDACLMANMETAMAAMPYADYLIASEETEPGTGWYYTDWMSALAKNSSLPTTTIGKNIIDDFTSASQQYSSRDKTSLSLIDLAEFSGTVPAIFSEFSKAIGTDIQGDNYRNVALARSNTKEFATSTKIDQIDLIHFCKNLGTTSSNALAESLQSCIKYNRAKNMNNAYGLSIYFPYYNSRYVNSAVQVYENLGMDSDYTKAVRSFATLAASGQVVNGYQSNTLFDILGGGSSGNSSYGYSTEDILNLLLGSSSVYESSYDDSYYGGSYGSGYTGSGYTLYDLLGGRSAVDEANVKSFAEKIDQNHLNPSDLILTENSNGEKVLKLSQEDWDKVASINLNVWVDDGKGYIDLGLDEVYRFDDEGSLVVEYNGNWTAINGQIVSFYPTSYEYINDNGWTFEGYVPILYNNERANILVEFRADNPNGSVLGIEKIYPDSNQKAKGYIEMNEGDVIEFLCDYYSYSGDYENTYKLGMPQIVTSEGLKVSTLRVDADRIIYGYRLSDICNANMWTQMLEYGG